MNHPLRIGTRGSQLALWQARWVQTAIQTHRPDIAVSLEIIKTKGDKILDVPLAKVGGKGLFVKEIEEALLDGRVDLAVHSMKDMPAEIPPGLTIGAVPLRENPLDALVSRQYNTIEELPPQARVGTSSLRRASQLLHHRPDLSIVALRGNLDTRLKKLESENLDAIILAAAGMRRLGLADRITALLNENQMLPAVGQGALCIETRTDDPVVTPIVTTMEDADTRTAVTAERAYLKRLEGGCQVPLAGHAHATGGMVHITGLVAELDGRRLIRESAGGPADRAATIGQALAETLLGRGADKILESLQNDA